MKILGIDFGWGRPKAVDVRKAGYRVVMRYLSHDPSKNLTKAEAHDELAAGNDIVVVWESTAANATKGAAAGKADAEAAVTELLSIGAPKGGAKPMCIYFAVDRDVAPAAVRPYFTAARQVVHAAGFRLGGYASYRVVNDLIHGGQIDLAWQTAAWSGGKVSVHADLYQNAHTVKIDGVTVDVDEVRAADYGGWRGALAPAPAKTAAKPKPKPAPAKAAPPKAPAGSSPHQQHVAAVAHQHRLHLLALLHRLHQAVRRTRTGPTKGKS